MDMTEETIIEGRVASRILTDPVFTKAVEEADAKFVQDWRLAETPAEREKAHAKQAALQEVQAQLRRIVATGEYEEEMEKRG